MKLGGLPLSRWEWELLEDLTLLFDPGKVRVHLGEGGRAARWLRRLVLLLSGGRAVTLGNHVFLPERGRGDLALLAHELTHCAQYQSWGALRYLTRGAAAQMRELLYRLLRLGASPYHYVIEPGKPFERYGMEQQAQIVEDCLRGDQAARRAAPLKFTSASAPRRPGPGTRRAR